MKRFAYALCLVVFAACGGGGGSSVSIVGDPPAEAAAEIADAICDQIVECGEVNFDCTFNQETQMVDCVGTIEEGPTHADCVAEEEPDILADLEACELTTEEQQLVEDCLNEQLAASCVTQEELDAWLEEVEMGSEEPLRPLSETCEMAYTLLNACSPQG